MVPNTADLISYVYMNINKEKYIFVFQKWNQLSSLFLLICMQITNFLKKWLGHLLWLLICKVSLLILRRFSENYY